MQIVLYCREHGGECGWLARRLAELPGADLLWLTDLSEFALRLTCETWSVGLVVLLVAGRKEAMGLSQLNSLLEHLRCLVLARDCGADELALLRSFYPRYLDNDAGGAVRILEIVKHVLAKQLTDSK